MYGFLSAASGLGALMGAIRLALRKTVLGLGRIIGWSSLIYAMAVAAFAISGHLALSMAIMPFVGWGMITNFAAANTILQTIVDDDKRGRVMSLFAMSFMGMTPFGVLIAGAMATRLSSDPFAGASRTLLVMSAVCVAASVRYWTKLPRIRAFIRPIYVQRGILPEIAAGLQLAAAPRPRKRSGGFGCKMPGSMSLEQIFESAVSHHQAGRLAEAEKIYRQILTQQPNHADALHLLGTLARHAGRLEAAAELFRQAIQFRPTNAILSQRPVHHLASHAGNLTRPSPPAVRLLH